MKKWQSWSTPKSQNCTREHVQTVCVSSSGGMRNAFFLDLHDSPPQVSHLSHQASLLCPPHCNPCHLQTWGPPALPLWQSRVLYTTAAEWPKVHSPGARESCDQVTAASAHLRLRSKGTLLEECTSSNKNQPLQECHTLTNASLPPSYEWNQAVKILSSNLDIYENRLKWVSLSCPELDSDLSSLRP